MAPSPDRATRLIYAMFFASGATALVYETAWVRLLTVALGSTVHAVSTVLTAFMAGLAIGSYLFGRVIDRGHAPLWVYAGLELALAAYAAAFVALHAAWPGVVISILPSDAEARLNWLATLAVAAAVMIPPAVLMGGTLPVLAKHVVRTSASLGSRLGALYGWNTLGAVAGCLLQAFVLTLAVGVRGSILCAAVVNAALAAAAVLLALFQRESLWEDSVAASSEEVASLPWREAAPAAPALLLFLAFASGGITLAAEVLWTRLFINFLSGNVLVFATILAGFLAGLGMGSLVVARFADRLQRIDLPVALTLIGSGVWLLLSAAGQGTIAGAFARLQRLESNTWPAAAPYVTLAGLFVLILPAGTTFGLTLPLLFRWGNRSWSHVGQGIGRLYAANTLGSIAGSAAAGFVLLKVVGLTASLLGLGAALAVISLFVSRSLFARTAAVAVAMASVELLYVPTVAKPRYWFNGGFSVVERIPPRETLFFDEGVEATVGVLERSGTRSLTVNGLIVADTSREDLWDLLLKAHLPMLLHHDPRRVALVGLGAGVSLGAVQAYDVERIDCIEISPEVIAAHRLFGHVNGRCWNDERTRLICDDGRHFLATTTERYDVINVDPVDPPICNLYTQDFFQLCHDRLADGGLMVEWLPLFRLSKEHLQVVMQAFVRVFPESTLWYDGTSILLIGSRGQPLRIDLRQVLRRSEQPRVLENLALIDNPGPWLLLSTFVTGPRGLSQLVGPGVPDNTDDYPFLEYDVLRAARLDSHALADNLEMLTAVGSPFDDWPLLEEATAEVRERLQHAAAVMRGLLDIRIHALRGEHQTALALRERAIKQFNLRAPDLKLLSPFLGKTFAAEHPLSTPDRP